MVSWLGLWNIHFFNLQLGFGNVLNLGTSNGWVPNILKCRSVPLSLSVPHLQFLVFQHRYMSSTHPPSSLGISQPSSTDLLLKETQCPHWPPLVPVVSSSSVRLQCCVAASDVEGKQNLGTKTGRHEGRGWLGIRFCWGERMPCMLKLIMFCIQAVWSVWQVWND